MLKQTPISNPPAPDFELIELFFFAYRDFVGEPDRLLAQHGFGRAHHRVLHFVNRHQGLTVAELLEILDITKQSLARVLKELVSAGFIDPRAGVEDRRQRLLYLTLRGRDFAHELAGMQGRRFARALAALPPDARETVARFLDGIIDEGRRHDPRKRATSGDQHDRMAPGGDPKGEE